MLKEFKAFIFRGNVISLAVGIIIGAAFNDIVKAIVDNILMPVVGILTGGYDFKSLAITVHNAKIQYGMAIQASVSFIIIAFSLFLIVKAANAATKKEEAAAPPAPTKEEILLAEIRDLLKK
jgi:large conductance mechanosensitive channel